MCGRHGSALPGPRWQCEKGVCPVVFGVKTDSGNLDPSAEAMAGASLILLAPGSLDNKIGMPALLGFLDRKK